MDKGIAGRNVVVTGGTGALGAVVVDRLLQAGAICYVPAREARGAGDARHERLHLVAGVDLSDEAGVDRFFDGVPELWASVHLAGDFVQQLEVNTLTAFLCCRAAVRGMRRAGHGGRIVNVAARPGLEPRRGAGMAAYTASKAAVAALTIALAEELKREHILVNAIAPSTLDTPANRRAMPDADTSRWLSPAAAAETILHLISPANTEVSGAVLPLYARA
jgi:NAD(P)-dependent dehydrogenase (short-subunit alcohol dehydrogenase family)